MEQFMKINTAVNGFVWGPVMLVLLVGTGVYLSIAVGFIQFTKIGYWWKNTIGKIFKKGEAGDGEITPLDKTWIGNANPKFTFGMTNNFSWKGLNLNILITGSYGNDIFNASKMEMMGMYDGKNQITDVLRRWVIPGQITDVPKAGFDMKNSSYFIEDGSYLRVKDITLSYDFSGAWMKKVGLTKLQPYFTATNLLTWTKYSGMDPEVNQWGNSGAVQASTGAHIPRHAASLWVLTSYSKPIQPTTT